LFWGFISVFYFDNYLWVVLLLLVYWGFAMLLWKDLRFLYLNKFIGESVYWLWGACSCSFCCWLEQAGVGVLEFS
jgi:hypothetical protein